MLGRLWRKARGRRGDSPEPIGPDETQALASIDGASPSLSRAPGSELPHFPHYRVETVLGSGGMGVVYAAVDERLGRPVAIKTLRAGHDDPAARERLLREARIAAALSHPHICRIYEIGGIETEPYIVMERLEGESLADRIAQSPLAPEEACAVAIGILEGLDALHSANGVHRDLKPSNVFLTPHGVKLLDFGLARPIVRTALSGEAEPTVSGLTTPGMVIGTPRYMAPEQLAGESVDGRADLFAAGAVLFEMLTGRPAFGGQTPLEVFHAVMFEQPPALSGSDQADALSRVIQRAVVKKRERRYASARLMAADLREVLSRIASVSTPVHVRPISRLLVLPFRILRPDIETDFLATSLSEAISSALSQLDSLVVRSHWLAPGGHADGDWKRVVAEAEVDLVLAGSLLARDGRIRVHTQLLEAPSGDVVWSHSSETSARDAFRIEDEIVNRVVDSLALPLGERQERVLRRDIPASPFAYELFLRGNQQSHAPDGWRVARDLFQRCVEEDPRYAPAWVRLARAEFLLGKYTANEDPSWTAAETALQRALELNPELPMAHQIYAQLEVSAGRPLDALRRLVARAESHPHDPDVFSGLVLTLRYVGLLEESLAAHFQARALDPKAKTSVVHTYFMFGQYDDALRESSQDIGYMDSLCLVMLGKSEEARKRLDRRERTLEEGNVRRWVTSLRAMLEGETDEAILALDGLEREFRDPEGLYYVARSWAWLGVSDRALGLLDQSVRGGFFCHPALARDPWLEPLRSSDRFRELASWTLERQGEASEQMSRVTGPWG